MELNIDDFEYSLNELIDYGEMLYHSFYYELDENEFLSLRGKGTAPWCFDEILEGYISFTKEYQIWYTESLEVIKQLIPDRLRNFRDLYDSASEICIKNYFIHINSKYEEINKIYDKSEAYKKLFLQQLGILKSAKKRLKSSLFDIKNIVQADLFDNELDSANELNDKGFVRGAGAIAGVVLEKHLLDVCNNHMLKIEKQTPCISDLNDLLKKESIIEIDVWRFIQHLGDLRNLCDHKKLVEPTKEKVKELIEGVDKVIKTVF